jgi:hypothetical protein
VEKLEASDNDPLLDCSVGLVVERPRGIPFLKSSGVTDLSKKVVALVNGVPLGRQHMLQAKTGREQLGKRLKKSDERPIQKGKNFITRTAKTITQRLGSGGDRKAASDDGFKGRVVDNVEGLEYDITNENSQLKISHIAEGAKMGNLKINHLARDRKIPRKPLESYMDLHSTQRQPFLDNPFSDLNETEEAAGYNGVKPVDKKQAFEMIDTYNLLDFDGPIDTPTDSGSEDDQHSRPIYHQNIFLSSPSGQSTPRFRLEQKMTAAGRSRLWPVVVGAGVDLEEEMDQPGSWGSSVGLKRKNGKEDLRDTQVSIPKRARPGVGSKKEPSLTTQMTQLNTGRRPLDAKDRNQAVHRSSMLDPKTNGKGLDIFKVPKGKEPMRRSTGASQRTKDTLMVHQPRREALTDCIPDRGSRELKTLLFERDSVSSDELAKA